MKLRWGEKNERRQKLSRRGRSDYEVKKEMRRRRNDWMVWDHLSKVHGQK
jgi:hypothetical protein